MKITGIAIMIIGLASLLFSGVMATQADPTGGTHAAQDLTMPLVVGCLAVLAGALLVAFGGRGYFASRNLAVRN